MSAISAAMVKDLRERTGLGMMECKKALVEAGGDAELAIENLRKSSGMKAAKKAGRVAAEGVVLVRSEEGKAVILEVNCETDLVARDDSFLAFAADVADAALSSASSDVAELLAGELEARREALVQKIGENISVRRFVRLISDGTIGSYVHGNSRIAVLTELTGGTEELARDVAMHVAAVSPRVAKPEEMPQELIASEKDIYVAQASESGKPTEIVEKMVEGRLRKFLSENSLVDQAFVKDPDQTVGKLLKSGGADIRGFVRFEVGEGIEKKQEDFAAEVAAQVQGAKG